MKILFFNTFSTVHGGAERLLFDTCGELLERSHELSIVFANDGRRAPNPEFWPSRINRYYVPELLVPFTDRYTYDRLRKAQAYRDTIRYVQDIIDLEAPDLIHVHHFPSVEVFKELRVDVPLIRTIHSYENQCETHLKRLPDGSICPHPLGKACQKYCGFEKSFRATRIRMESRYMRERFDRLIAVSSFGKDLLITNGFDEDKVTVLPNFTRFPVDTREVPDENLVLYVGRLTPEKGLLELLEALSRTRTKPKLLVVGKDGILGQSSFQNAVDKRIGELGLDVEFEGWKVGDALRRCYVRAKVVAFGSVWPEPFGLVGIEAMTQGKPVVAYDAGGVRDWLRHEETGFLVPHLDIDRYAARIDQLLQDDELRQVMGRNAQRVAALDFTPETYVTRLLGVYEDELNEDAADRPRWSPAVRHAQCGSGLSV